MLLAGCQLDRSNFHNEVHQGHLATQGATTELPFTLAYEPFSDSAIWIFLNGRITINARDFSVDVPNRKITWLSTAPYGLTTVDWMVVSYFSKF